MSFTPAELAAISKRPPARFAKTGGRCCGCRNRYYKYDEVFRINGRNFCQCCAGGFERDYNGKWAWKRQQKGVDA